MPKPKFQQQEPPLFGLLLAGILGFGIYFFTGGPGPTHDWRAPANAQSSRPTDYSTRLRIAQSMRSSPFATRKLQLNSGEMRRIRTQASARGIRTSPSAQNSLPAGAELALQVDHACLLRERSLLVPPAFQARIERNELPGSSSSLRIQLEREIEIAQLSQQIESDPCIEGAGSEGRVKKHGFYADPESGNQFQLGASGALSAESFLLFSSLRPISRTRIAIIDTGVDYRHPDLGAAMARDSRGRFGYDFANLDDDPSDDDGHGTHVAGLASAPSNGLGVTGISPRDSEILAVKVLDSTGTGYFSDVANGIRYAADEGAQVINLSLSGLGSSSVVEAALVYALNRGVVIFVSAGNDGIRIDQNTNFITPASYGAQYPGVITVGSLDTQTRRRSSFSNFGDPTVEIMAPGQTGIRSTLPNGAYGNLNGTSMSSPVAAGAALLLISALRAQQAIFTPAIIEDILARGATPNAQLQGFVRGNAELNIAGSARVLEKNYLLTFQGGWEDN